MQGPGISHFNKENYLLAEVLCIHIKFYFCFCCFVLHIDDHLENINCFLQSAKRVSYCAEQLRHISCEALNDCITLASQTQ